MSVASVQILTFAGCPNREGASELVERVAHALPVELDLELLEVADTEAAVRLRFLGSPTIRVGGRDVEPGAEQRTDYALSCRIYRTAAGAQGQLEEAWVRDALLAQTRPAA
jgi:hypothetical protein